MAHTVRNAMKGQAQKAPTKTFLGMRTPEAIYDALAIGIMRPMAVRLTDEQKHHVAEDLSGTLSRKAGLGGSVGGGGPVVHDGMVYMSKGLTCRSAEGSAASGVP